jgi:hypothetical protein
VATEGKEESKVNGKGERLEGTKGRSNGTKRLFDTTQGETGKDSRQGLFGWVFL